MQSSLGVRTDDNWHQLLQFLPPGWQAKAKELQAYHRLPGIPSVECLLRILFLHLVEGLSLVQTANIAAQVGWAQISDVSILKRLRQAEQWLRWMSLELATHAHPARLRFAPGLGNPLPGAESGCDRGQRAGEHGNHLARPL